MKINIDIRFFFFFKIIGFDRREVENVKGFSIGSETDFIELLTVFVRLLVTENIKNGV